MLASSPDLGGVATFALTSMQTGLLSESLLADQGWANLEQLVVTFRETLISAQQITSGLALLVERYDALRLRFERDNLGKLAQAVTPSVHLPFQSDNNPSVCDATRAEQLENILEQDRARGFALTDQVLWRARFVSWGETDSVLILTIHHAVTDGRSMARMLHDLLTFLHIGHFPSADHAARSFEEYCREIAETVPNAAQAEDYFKSYLHDAEDAGVLALPVQDMTSATSRKRHFRTTLDAAKGQRLRQLAVETNTTLANVFQAAWGVLLVRWQGKDDIVFGTVRSGRHALSNCLDTVGCLINTLPARVTLDHDLNVSALLSSLRAHTLALHPLEQTPMTVVRQSVGLHGAQPLFETAIMFENAGMQALVSKNLQSSPAQSIELREEGGMPLMLSVYAEDDIDMLLEYDPSRVDDETADRLFRHLVQLIEAFSNADGGTLIAQLQMLDPDERDMLLAWSVSDTPLEDPGTCLVQKFNAILQAIPDAIMLKDLTQAETLTYAEVNQRSECLAQVLRQHGAAPGQIVAVNLPRSNGFVIALLAALKTGAAFMPVDPAHPDATREHMMSDSQAKIIVRPDAVISDGKITQTSEIPKHSDNPVSGPSQDPEQLAYVIYTSGSTGKPKGVRVLRRNLLAHLAAVTDAFDLKSDDCALQFAGLSFDVAIEEIFSTIMSGATLVLRTKEMAESTAEFLEQVDAHDVTVLNIPTAFWTVLTQYIRDAERPFPPAVRLVVVGGERISPQTLADWQQLVPGPRWLNGYGPTETTITCTLSEPGPQKVDEEVSIGRPTAHALAYILAPDGSLAPNRAIGELVIGGQAVSDGYVGRPTETEQAFRMDMFAAPGRIYRTGDRARWLDSGDLGFLGRQDRQVKLRGYRIDLRHVERAVEQCLPGVELLCGVFSENTPSARLVAWIASDKDLDLEQVASDVAALLPNFMVPVFVVLPRFERTPNGKIDTQRLPHPAPVESTKEDSAKPASDLERQVCDTMAMVLQLDEVTPNQSFFDLGGHSLLSIEFIGRIEVTTGKRLGIADFNANPTPRAVTRVLESGKRSSKHIIPIQPEGSKPPLLAIHILGTNEEYFHPLARRLGLDQPVMGVSVGSLDENTPTGIKFTASRYCEDINEHYPDGPIHLMAVSLGSYIAFELARQLRGLGRDVGLVALFDAAGPGGRTQVSGLSKVRAHMRRARSLGWAYPKQIIDNRMHNIRNAIAARQIKHKSDDTENYAPKTVFEFIASNELAVREYYPQPIDVPLVIFRSNVNFFDSEETKNAGLGWATVAHAGFDVIDVPGGHLSLLQEPHVETLAMEIQGALNSL